MLQLVQLIAVQRYAAFLPSPAPAPVFSLLSLNPAMRRSDHTGRRVCHQ